MWKMDYQISSNNYRLCISSLTGHRDFTLDEAEEILSPLLNVNGRIEMVPKTNHPLPQPVDSYIKITEYYSSGPSDIEEHTVYLTPDGKIINHLRTIVANRYYSGDWESFECNLMWISVEDFDYDAFLKLLNE